MSHTREEEWKQVRALHLVRDERDREVGEPENLFEEYNNSGYAN